MPLKVSIVEDKTPVRESLSILINGAEGFRCAGAHATGEHALKNIPLDRPDVVLMDLELPGMSGIECTAKLKAKLPSTPILMFTVYEESDEVFEALKAGATGYLVKRTTPAKLLEAIEEAHRGGSPMSPQIARKVVQYFHRFGLSETETENLSKREQEILEHLSKGYLYKEIADALDISVETVRRHLTHIYAKLHVRTRTEAVVKYLKRS